MKGNREKEIEICLPLTKVCGCGYNNIYETMSIIKRHCFITKLLDKGEHQIYGKLL